MSRTKKDLKSHRKGFGKYNNRPQRKLASFIHDINKVVGRNEVLACQPENDISQENGQFYGAKQVRSIRRRLRTERDCEKSRARARIRQHDKKIEKNLEI